MKTLRYNIILVSLITLLGGCNSGSSSSNPDSLEGVTVQTFFPPNGTTDMGLGEHLEVIFNKQVNPNLVKQYITLESLNSNEDIDINLTNGADGGLDINPVGGLQPDTTYIVNITLPSSEESSVQTASTTTTYTVTTQPMYKIYMTNQTVKGNLGNPNTGMNPKEWADNLCNTDTARPTTNVTYKAMLSINDLRYACNDDGYCGTGHNLDWTLQPNVTYYNTLNENIATANAFSVFAFPTNAVIKNVDAKVWTGLTGSWGNNGSNQCSTWTSTSGGKSGKVGWANKADDRMIYYDSHDCDRNRALYCVQQPQVVITSPEISPLNQYTVTNYNSPITVTFNSVNPINGATVTTSSFSVISATTNTPVTGTITNNGNNIFTFIPSVAYTAGTQYYVNLTSNIQDSLGNSITPTTLFFYTASASKLMFMTTGDYWGDVGGITGADSKCQADTQCPSGKTCKAILMDAQERYACTAIGQCGGANSYNWVLTPSTTYINTRGQIIATTNTSSTFGSDGSFVFNYPIDITGGNAWTGFDNNFMIVYHEGSPVTCKSWSIGDGGVNALGGMYGNAASVYPYAFVQTAGGCSKYTNQINYGVYVDKQCSIDGGCSERHLYCAEQ